LYLAAADALAAAHESGLSAGQDIRGRSWNDEAVLSETNYNSGNYTLEYRIYDSNNNQVGTYKPTWSELTAKAQVIQNAITLVDGSAVVGSSSDGTDNVVVSVDDAALLSAGVESSFEIVLIGDDGSESSYYYNPTRVIESITDDDFYYSLSGSSSPLQFVTTELLVPKLPIKTPTELALQSIGDYIPAGIDWSFVGEFDPNEIAAPNGLYTNFVNSLYIGVDIASMGALASEEFYAGYTYGDIHYAYTYTGYSSEYPLMIVGLGSKSGGMVFDSPTYGV